MTIEDNVLNKGYQISVHTMKELPDQNVLREWDKNGTMKFIFYLQSKNTIYVFENWPPFPTLVQTSDLGKYPMHWSWSVCMSLSVVVVLLIVVSRSVLCRGAATDTPSNRFANIYLLLPVYFSDIVFRTTPNSFHSVYMTESEQKCSA